MQTKTLKDAGGFRAVRGCKSARNFHTFERKPWISATRRHIRQTLKANDWQTKLMVQEAERELTGSLATVKQRPGKHGTPLDRAKDILGWIIQQGRFNALDVVTVALATAVMCRHWEHAPLRTPYFIAVQIGKAIHKMLRADVREYVHDDGHGNIWTEVVRYKKALTSRCVCQRLQKITEGIYSDYKARHSSAIAGLVVRKQWASSTVVSDSASRSSSRTVPTSLT